MRLILLGAPGAGKGTQARKLQDRFGLMQVSIGDMLRQARKDGTELGMEAARYMDSGQLVPDDVVVGIVAQRLGLPDLEKGFVLDGFPRTVPQAEALDRMGVALDAVVNLVVDEDELVERLAGRLTCGSCGAMFHRTYAPPRTEGVCDACGSSVGQRVDDTEETVRNRLSVYRRQTFPLVEYYSGKGKLLEIDGTGSTPDKVFDRLLSLLCP